MRATQRQVAIGVHAPLIILDVAGASPIHTAVARGLLQIAQVLWPAWLRSNARLIYRIDFGVLQLAGGK
jgi:hypothetical protein